MEPGVASVHSVSAPAVDVFQAAWDDDDTMAAAASVALPTNAAGTVRPAEELPIREVRAR